MTQQQYRLAIVKIVPRKQLIEADQIVAQKLYLGVVKLGEKWSDRIGSEHGCEARQQLRQFGRNLRQLFDCPIGRGQSRLQF